MECPFANFIYDKKATAATSPVTVPSSVADNSADVTFERQGSYTGEYPKACKLDANMPANAKPAWPKSNYISLVSPQCAPCYTYTNKRGLDIMECPGLIFIPDVR